MDFELLPDGSGSENSDDESLIGSTDDEQEIDDLGDQAESIKTRFNQLLNSKYDTIMAFNRNELDKDRYYISIGQINEQINNLINADDELIADSISKELQLSELLTEFNEKIKRILSINKNARDFLTQEDIERVNTLRLLINKVQMVVQEIQIEDGPEFDDNGNLLEETTEKNEAELELVAKEKGIQKPLAENFATEQLYKDALERYYENLAVIRFFSPFEEQEMKKIDALAKENGIKKPKPGSADYEKKLEIFYKEVSQLLPGYIFKMKTTSVGFVYEELDMRKLKEKVQEDIKLLKELPIILKPEELERSRKMKTLSGVLGKMKRSDLINCIIDSGVKIPRQPKPEQTPGVSEFKRIETLLQLPGKRKKWEELKRPQATFLSKRETPEEWKKYTFRKEISSTFNKNELRKNREKTMRKRLLNELLQKYNTFFKKKKKESLPKIIPNSLRNLHSRRITESLKKDIPLELVPFVDQTVQSMENFIYKISPLFLDYVNKIEDILFIFDNYPSFKVKLLEQIPVQSRKSGNIIYKTDLNVYQIVLFEKELNYEARLHVFPVNVGTRKSVINKLFFELFNQTAFRQSKILNEILSEKFSKKIENVLFEISGNQTNYLNNTKNVIFLIKRIGNEILYGKITIDKLVRLLNIINSEASEKKDLFNKWTTSNLSYIDFMKSVNTMIGPTNNIYYNNFSVVQLGALINDTKEEIRRLTRNGYTPAVKELDEKLKVLQETFNLKNAKSFTDYKERYLKFLKNKYGNLPLPAYPEFRPITLNYQNVNIELVNEVVQAFKRNLILYDYRNFKKFPYKQKTTSSGIVYSGIDYIPKKVTPTFYKLITDSVEDKETVRVYTKHFEEIVRVYLTADGENVRVKIVPREEQVSIRTIVPKYYSTQNVEQEKTITTESYEPNLVKVYIKADDENVKVMLKPYSTVEDKRGLLISYIELYDLNVLYSKQKDVLKPELYNRIKRELLGIINQYTSSSYETINARYYKIAINTLLTAFGLSTEAENNNTLLQRLVNSWPKVYTSQNQFVDFYGEDLFYKLLQSKSPFGFYNTTEIRNYNSLVKQNTRAQSGEFTKPMILFNEAKGTFGNAASDGLVYQVQMLDKDPSTGVPIPQTETIMEKDPRTGKWLSVSKTVYRRGPYPFILRYIGTSQTGKSQESWLEVPLGSVKRYTYDYDSCSRFKTEEDCKGPGLNNSTCVFQNGKCKADYTKPFTFGKKVKKLTKVKKIKKIKK